MANITNNNSNSISCRYGTHRKYFFLLFIYCEREAEESNKNNDDEFISHDLTRKKRQKIDVAASSDIHCLMLCMVLLGYNSSSILVIINAVLKHFMNIEKFLGEPMESEFYDFRGNWSCF